jgi:hypothetical protein
MPVMKNPGMDFAKRKVVEVPLRELWNDHGLVPAEMTRDELREDEITALLRAGVVQFVFAPFSGHLHWVPVEERFNFWKESVHPRLTQWVPDGRVYADDFPDGFIIASLWEVRGSSTPHVLATEYH